MFAQKSKTEKPDYKKIEEEISNKKSNSYYPLLITRYNKSDTTLTKEEFELLYYGSFFQDSFSAYSHSDYSDSLRQVLSKESLLTSDYDKIIRFEKAVLNKFPFNLRDLNTLAYAYDKKGMQDSVKFINFKLDNVINTILNSGDGKSSKTGWHVVSVGDEYSILNILGYEFGGEQSLIGRCDYLAVKKNKDNINGFYFDVTKILESEEKLFGGK